MPPPPSPSPHVTFGVLMLVLALGAVVCVDVGTLVSGLLLLSRGEYSLLAIATAVAGGLAAAQQLTLLSHPFCLGACDTRVQMAVIWTTFLVLPSVVFVVGLALRYSVPDIVGAALVCGSGLGLLNALLISVLASSVRWCGGARPDGEEGSTLL